MFAYAFIVTRSHSASSNPYIRYCFLPSPSSITRFSRYVISLRCIGALKSHTETWKEWLHSTHVISWCTYFNFQCFGMRLTVSTKRIRFNCWTRLSMINLAKKKSCHILFSIRIHNSMIRFDAGELTFAFI